MLLVVHGPAWVPRVHAAHVPHAQQRAELLRQSQDQVTGFSQDTPPHSITCLCTPARQLRGCEVLRQHPQLCALLKGACCMQPSCVCSKSVCMQLVLV
jgi:hypothetical protein